MVHDFGGKRRQYEALDEAILPPAAKRDKIAGGAALREEKTVKELPRESKMMPEFRAETLDDFYKPCPNYRLPAEIGAFSFGDDGAFCLDRSQLRYYNPPSQMSRLSMDLKVGYDGYIAKEKSGAADLEPILRWISVNGQCFKPKSEPLSPNNGISIDPTAGAYNAAASSNER